MNKQKTSLTQENTQSLSQESLKEKRKHLLVCIPFPILNLCHDIGVFSTFPDI